MPKWSEAALARHPERACNCCIHITRADLADEVIGDVWAMCPDSGCVWRLCDECQARMSQSESVRTSRRAQAVQKAPDRSGAVA